MTGQAKWWRTFFCDDQRILAHDTGFTGFLRFNEYTVLHREEKVALYQRLEFGQDEKIRHMSSWVMGQRLKMCFQKHSVWEIRMESGRKEKEEKWKISKSPSWMKVEMIALEMFRYCCCRNELAQRLTPATHGAAEKWGRANEPEERRRRTGWPQGMECMLHVWKEWVRLPPDSSLEHSPYTHTLTSSCSMPALASSGNRQVMVLCVWSQRRGREQADRMFNRRRNFFFLYLLSFFANTTRRNRTEKNVLVWAVIFHQDRNPVAGDRRVMDVLTMCFVIHESCVC